MYFSAVYKPPSLLYFVTAAQTSTTALFVTRGLNRKINTRLDGLLQILTEFFLKHRLWVQHSVTVYVKTIQKDPACACCPEVTLAIPYFHSGQGTARIVRPLIELDVWSLRHMLKIHSQKYRIINTGFKDGVVGQTNVSQIYRLLTSYLTSTPQLPHLCNGLAGSSLIFTSQVCFKD